MVSMCESMEHLDDDTRMCFETLVNQLDHAREMLDEKEEVIDMLGKNEREVADEIASLSQSLEDEHNMRITLEESVAKLVDDHNAFITQLVKERDHAIASLNVLKNEKVEFGVGHECLKDFEKLKEEHHALESKFSSIFEAHEQLQMQLNNEQSKSYATPIVHLSCSSNPCCKHENLLRRTRH